MQWQPIDNNYRAYTEIVGMDCRADWLLNDQVSAGADAFLVDGPLTRVPVLMRLHDVQGIDAFEDIYRTDRPLLLSFANRERLKNGKYATAFAPLSFFDSLATKGGDWAVLRRAPKEIVLCVPPRLAYQAPWAPGDPAPRRPPRPPDPGRRWPPDTVVVGIVDDGIAFAHERFRNSRLSTRIEHFWLQEHPYVGVPPHVIGIELDRNDIDTLLGRFDINGAVDEDALYRAADVIDFSDPERRTASQRAAHGTHVLDLAAGEDFRLGMRNRPIIAVQLPSPITADTSGANLEAAALYAVDYIVDKADALTGPGRKLPVVINFSYGLQAGPHDGTSSLERALEERIQDRQANGGELRIVVPAGNSHLSGCHAEVRFNDPNQEVGLGWRVQPDDRTPSFMEVWLPFTDGDAPANSRMELRVETPGGIVSPWIGEVPSSGAILVDGGGRVICEARYAFMGDPTGRGHYCISLQPTTRLDPAGGAVAPCGRWTVRLRNLHLGMNEAVHAWIERSDTPYGYPLRGRQSYFDDPDYQVFNIEGSTAPAPSYQPWRVSEGEGALIEEDAQNQPPSVVMRAGSMSGIATGATPESPVTVGGFHAKDGWPALYSAGGPVTPPRAEAPDDRLRKPDVLTVSEDSSVHSGVRGAGSRSGSVVTFTGTSFAAPKVTRWIAGRLADNAGLPPEPIGSRRGDRLDVAENLARRGELVLAALVPQPPRSDLPADRGGWGRALDREVPMPVNRHDRYWR